MNAFDERSIGLQHASMSLPQGVLSVNSRGRRWSKGKVTIYPVFLWTHSISLKPHSRRNPFWTKAASKLVAFDSRQFQVSFWRTVPRCIGSHFIARKNVSSCTQKCYHFDLIISFSRHKQWSIWFPFLRVFLLLPLPNNSLFVVKSIHQQLRLPPPGREKGLYPITLMCRFHPKHKCNCNFCRTYLDINRSYPTGIFNIASSSVHNSSWNSWLCDQVLKTA